MTPLEQLQPSIAALTKAYFSDFPEIVAPSQFLRRVVQFSGLALIQIQAIQYQKSFDNTGICMLQVAKLYCVVRTITLTVLNGRISTHLSQSFSC